MRAAVIGFSLLSLAFASQLKAEDEVEFSKFFGDWSSFFDYDLCWIGSHPLNASEEREEDIYIFISFFHGSSDFEITIYSESFANNISEAKLKSGDNYFKLIASDDFFYLLEEDENPTFWNLFHRNPTELYIKDTSGEEVNFKFSSYGFALAYQHIVSDCDFNMRRRLNSDGDLEPT